MIVKEPDVIEIIQEIGEHYRKNIDNKYVKKAFTNLSLDLSDINRINSFTAKSNYSVEYEYGLDELYECILALARFIHEVKANILSNLKSLAGTVSPASGNEKVLQGIAINNFPSNLGILSDMVQKLLLKTAEIDRETFGEAKMFMKKNPALKDIGQLLIS